MATTIRGGRALVRTGRLMPGVYRVIAVVRGVPLAQPCGYGYADSVSLGAARSAPATYAHFMLKPAFALQLSVANHVQYRTDSLLHQRNPHDLF